MTGIDEDDPKLLKPNTLCKVQLALRRRRQRAMSGGTQEPVDYYTKGLVDDLPLGDVDRFEQHAMSRRQIVPGGPHDTRGPLDIRGAQLLAAF
jgi:hypothetical protein